MSGVVATKKHSDSVGKEHNILKEDGVKLDQDEMPSEIVPKGLSLQRQSMIRSESSALSRAICFHGQTVDSHLQSPSSPSHPPPAKRLWTVWPTWSQQEELYSGLFSQLDICVTRFATH